MSGTADVFEATVSIRMIDETNNVIADTFTTATCGTGCRGDYSERVTFSVDREQPGKIQVFEVSAKDSSMINVVTIPVTLVPGPPDEVAAALEGAWQDADGTTVGDGLQGGPLVLRTREGPSHCGWSSITFLDAAWPLGNAQTTAGDPWRQYARDPDGVLASQERVAFGPAATLPADATFSGYSHGAWQLWTSPGDLDVAVYLFDTGSQSVERWPRIRPVALCD